jgi:hypothetical protein
LLQHLRIDEALSAAHRIEIIMEEDLAEFGAKVIFLVLPIDHIARFAAMIAHGIRMGGFGGVSIVPVCYNDWHSIPGYHSRLSAMREAYGPTHLLPGDEIDEASVKQRCGQLTDRWYNDNQKLVAGQYKIGPVLPSELLAFLQAQPIRWW